MQLILTVAIAALYQGIHKYIHKWLATYKHKWQLILTVALAALYQGSPEHLGGSLLTIFLFLLGHVLFKPFINTGACVCVCVCVCMHVCV